MFFCGFLQNRANEILKRANIGTALSLGRRNLSLKIIFAERKKVIADLTKR